MTAPDSVKQCTCSMAIRLCGDGCDVCNPEKALKYAMETIEDLNRIIAEKDARIAELECSDAESLALCRERAARIAEIERNLRAAYQHSQPQCEAERDALRTQLADAVETLKAARQSISGDPFTYKTLCDCLKRLGVTP